MLSDRLAEQLRLLPDYLGNHLLLVLTALGIGILLSLPLALAATRSRRLESVLLATTGVLQTVPSLALLALMVPLLGRIGFLPALIALVLYSMLPVVRNTIAGVHSVDASLVEAATGLGMTDLQVLLRIQLPLAMTVIMAGIRTAAVWVVGAATLSTPVGASSLGNYIFSGLQTQNYTAVTVGVAAAALLALFLDRVLKVLERVAAGRPSAVLLLPAAGLAPLAAVGFLLAVSAAGTATLTIGAKTFTEQYIIAELLADRARAAGLQPRIVRSLGSTVVFDALVRGRLDVYVDYSGTVWANQMQRDDNPGRAVILSELSNWLERTHGIVNLGPLGFENTYALALRSDRAEALTLRTIEDLIPLSHGWSLGGDYEFFSRPEWRAVQDAYGLEFQETLSLDPSLLYSAVQSGELDAISAFSTDGRIAAFGLRVLSDNRHALPPYDAVLLVSAAAARRRAVIEALRPLVQSIDNSLMRRANLRVDVEGEGVASAASWLSGQLREETQ